MRQIPVFFSILLAALLPAAAWAAAPVAKAIAVNVNEDAPKAITLMATDADAGDKLTYSIVTLPNLAYGKLGAVIGNSVTFSPKPNWNSGPSGTTKATFTYQAKDAAGHISKPATVTVTVLAINDVPTVTTPLITTTNEDTSAIVGLSGSDVDGDKLTFMAGPVNNGAGTVMVSGASVTFVPAANFNGMATFPFSASDGKLQSLAAMATVSVVAVNDAPTVSAITMRMSEDQTMPVMLVGSDVDGDAITFTAAPGAETHGTISVSGTNANYTPDANYVGSASFPYTATDGNLISSFATVSLDIAPLNDAPTANTVTGSTNEDESVAIALSGSDPDGDALTYSATGATHGSVSIFGSTATFTPEANFNGTASFNVTASDGSLSSTLAAATVMVTAVNDAPTANGASVTTDQDKPVSLTLSGSDPEGDALTYAPGSVSHGTVSISGASATFTPEEGYSGAVSFAFTANDGKLASPAATVAVTVNRVNTAPTATNVSASCEEDKTASVTLAGSDADGDALQYSVGTAAHGTVAVSGNVATYNPTKDYNGTDTFSFTADDAQGGVASASVTVTVSAVNDAPVAEDVEVSGDEDSWITVTLNATDPEGDKIAYTLLSCDKMYCQNPGASPATADGKNDKLFVISNVEEIQNGGTGTLTYRATDASGAVSNTATVTITLGDVDETPAAIMRSATTTINEPIEVRLSGYDAEDAELTFAITGAAHGTAAMIDDDVAEFVPEEDYDGAEAKFSFTVSDGVNTSVPVTVPVSLQGWKVPGKTYYVAQYGGSDSNDGSAAAPFQSIATGVKKLTAGDRLYIHEGTYEETIFDTIPAGTDWDHPVTIQTYPGEKVILKPAVGCGRPLYFLGTAAAPKRYIIVDDIIVDADNCTSDAVKIATTTGATSASGYIRIQNTELKNSCNQGVLVSAAGGYSSSTDHNEFLYLHVHDNGSANSVCDPALAASHQDGKFRHGFYVSTSYNTVDHCTVHHNTGYGMKAYVEDGGDMSNPFHSSSYNTFSHNFIFKNYFGGMGLFTGTGNAAYDNVMWRGGIDNEYSAVGTKIYDNTVYMAGISVYTGSTNTEVSGNNIAYNTGPGIYVDPNNSGTVVKNNAMYHNYMYANSRTYYSNLSSEAAAKVTTLSGNIGINNVATSTSSAGMLGVTHPLWSGVDPLFADPAHLDFRLQSASPAIGTGICLEDVLDDLVGTVRPTSGCDMGAFEM